MKINAKYVTFDQAKKLKEKGFNELTKSHYEKALTSKKNNEGKYEGTFGWKKGETNHSFDSFINNGENDYSGKNWYQCSSPEQWMVVDWFRLNHGIWVYLELSTNGKDFYPYIRICSETTWENLELRVKIDESRHHLLKYDSSEQSYSAAFDYILEKLI